MEIQRFSMLWLIFVWIFNWFLWFPEGVMRTLRKSNICQFSDSELRGFSVCCTFMRYYWRHNCNSRYFMSGHQRSSVFSPSLAVCPCLSLHAYICKQTTYKREREREGKRVRDEVKGSNFDPGSWITVCPYHLLSTTYNQFEFSTIDYLLKTTYYVLYGLFLMQHAQN